MIMERYLEELSQLREMRRRIKEASKAIIDIGIHPDFLALLQAMKKAGAAVPIKALEIAEPYSSNASYAIEWLTSRGYAKKSKHPDDRRIITVEITPLGLRALELVEEAYRNNQMRI